MAPEMKRQSDRKVSEASRYRQVATASNHPANTSNAILGTNSSFVEHRSSTNTNILESARHNSTSNGQVQTNKQEIYICIDRPWEQNVNGSNRLAVSIGTLPMDRWQTESMLDAPWHGMEKIYPLTSQDFLLENNRMDGGGGGDWEGRTEEARSMACVAPSSENRG
jgi:hypothetical protein